MATTGSLFEQPQRSYVVEALEEAQLKSNLPFRLSLRAVDAAGEDVACKTELTVSAVSSRTALAEGFERKTLGRW